MVDIGACSMASTDPPDAQIESCFKLATHPGMLLVLAQQLHHHPGDPAREKEVGEKKF